MTCTVSVMKWCQITMAELPNAAAIAVVCGHTALAPTHTHWPAGLLMVHAVLTLAVKVWLCGMTRI